jgi:mannose-6-phosphate isomerase-like protein (cupin superfamily)
MTSKGEHPMIEPSDAIPVRVTSERVEIGGFATTYLAAASTTAGAYALLEHTLAPGLLGAPPHRHAREDELSYVLEGTLTVWREGAVTEAGPGDLVRKPRGEWHTFWNAGPVPVRFLEVISPPEFAGYFRELADLIPKHGSPDPAQVAALAGRYGLELDFTALGPLMARHGLRLG